MWLGKTKILEKQFGEKLGNKMKIAIVTSMMPMTIQDHSFQVVSESRHFDGLLENIGAWV
jgi:hypothetical protein